MGTIYTLYMAVGGRETKWEQLQIVKLQKYLLGSQDDGSVQPLLQKMLKTGQGQELKDKGKKSTNTHEQQGLQ